MKKGVETSLMMNFWEAGEEEELYTILVLGMGMMLLLVGGRIETIGLLDDQLHLGFIYNEGSNDRYVEAVKLPGR